jgi:ribose transport system substrate-binding protein
MNGRRFVACLALAALLSLVITACGSASSSGTKAKTSTSGSGVSSSTGAGAGIVAKAQAAVTAAEAPLTKVSQTVPLPGPPPANKLIVYISTGSSTSAVISAGVHEAANALGWRFAELTSSLTDPAALQAALLNALTRHPDVVAEINSPPSLFGASTIAAYKAANVPIVVGETDPVVIGNPIFGTPGGAANEQRVGKMLANWFIADSDGHGKALVAATTFSPVLTAYTNSFNATVASNCPDCKIDVVPVSSAEYAANQLIPKAVAAARANPSYKYMFFDNASYATGIQSALNAAGLTDMKVGGRSVNPSAAAGLRDGSMQVWTGVNYYLVGISLADVGVRQLMNAAGASNDNILPVQLLTKSNVGNLTTNFAQPADSIEQYERLWNVPVTPCKLTCP